MKIVKWAALATVAVIAAAPTTVAADSYWEVEAARANARAGGPTNARDAELLERYGCLSGTRSGFASVWPVASAASTARGARRVELGSRGAPRLSAAKTICLRSCPLLGLKMPPGRR